MKSITISLLFTFLPFSNSFGGRITASDLLPVLGLVEPEGNLYDPKPSDLDVYNLRRILGSSFDSEVMSTQQPTAARLHPNGTVKLSIKKTRSGHLVPVGIPPRHIKRLHLHTMKLGEGKRVSLKMGNKMRRRFRDLIWLQSHCPLLQKWRDLGPRFWPRWFLENSCASRPTCSFPKGMICKPYKSVNKVLLRWHCQNWEMKKNCNWLKVQYPLVTECRCGC
ncbi:noggin-like [Parasteatoda tepidariorum]|uniref:noggin-like n=1 Tax=Parasteatoda tepidariorum TaxID=114398 RepID=UPI00077FAEC5|nr:noggin-like [Parasteatoda tepidariorum]